MSQLSTMSQRAPENLDKSPGAPYHKCRILLVEDNEDAADSMAVLLQLWGHEVYIADDGERAIEIASEIRPDVALLDIGLPALNGFEVAQHLRGREETRDTVIFAVTGYNRPEHHEHARQFGFDYYFHKPADLSCLQNIPASSTVRAVLADRLKHVPAVQIR
jgi:CheY-like chemotaxis protein